MTSNSLLSQKLDTVLHKNIADSLVLVSNEKFAETDYFNSANLRLEAITHLKKIADWKTTISEYNVVFSICSYGNDLVRTNSALDSALYLADLHLNDTDVEKLYVLSNVAWNQLQSSQYSLAIDNYERVIKGFEAKEEPFANYYNTIINLIDCYRYKGDNQTAIDLGEKYLLRTDTLQNDTRNSSVELLVRKGINQREYSDFSASTESLLLALQRNKETEDTYYKSSHHDRIVQALSRSYEMQTNIDSALYYINTLFDKKKKNKEALVYYNYWDLADIYNTAEDYNTAKSYYLKTLYLYEEFEFKLPQEQASLYARLGNISLKENKVDSAQYYFDATQEHLLIDDLDSLNEYNTFLEYSDFNKNTITNLSKIAEFETHKYINTGNISNKEKALHLYKIGFTGAKFLQKELLSNSSKYLLNKNIQDNFSNYCKLLFDSYEQTGETQYIDQIHQLIEDNKSIVLKEDIYEKAMLAQSDIPQSILEKETGIVSDMKNLTRLIYNHSLQENEDPQLVNNWKSDLVNLKQDYKKFQESLETDYPQYFKNKYALSSSNPQDIQSQLKKEEVYLNYIIVGDELLCFYLTQNNKQIQSLGSWSDIQLNIDQLSKIITSPNQDSKEHLDNFQSVSHALYNDLIPEDLNNNTFFKYIISPTAALHSVPFEVLTSSINNDAKSFKPLPYLIKEKTIEYSYSADLWIAAKKGETSKKSIEVVSFAPFTDTNSIPSNVRGVNNELNALECSLDEINAISKEFNNTQFVNQHASLESFKEADFKPILHLATHAFLDDNNPEFNKLIFSDDYLAIQDLEAMNINSKLAILSACNTGSGAIRSGEGVITLGKGFRNAGIHSLISSLWPLNDCATADVISNFYSGLKKNGDISGALRNAKITYLENSDKRHAHPYYWAGLTFNGNSEALADSSKGIFSLRNFVFLLVGLLLLVWYYWKGK